MGVQPEVEERNREFTFCFGNLWECGRNLVGGESIAGPSKVVTFW